MHDRAIDLLSTYHALGRFSGVAAVAVGGVGVFEAALGLADRERGAPLTANTRFPIGSLSKMLTAVAVLRLEAAGAIELHAPIGTYLGDMGLAWGGVVDVHHLLTHTSGIPGLYTDHPGVRSPSASESCRPVDTKELVSRFARLPLRFEPGERFEYCNSGYVLLAALVERVSHQPYWTFLADQLLARCEMRDTGPMDSARSRSGDAIGTVAGRRAPLMHPSWALGIGDLESTASDVLSWAHALQDDTLLSGPSRRRMLTPHVPIDEGTGHGYGCRVREDSRHRLVFQTGTLPGFLSALHVWPEEGAAAVVLVNAVRDASHLEHASRAIARIANQLGAIRRGDPIELPPPRRAALSLEQRAALVGNYEVAADATLEVLARGDALFARASGPRAWTLQAAGWLRERPASLRVSRAEAFLDALVEGRPDDAAALACSALVEAIGPVGLAETWRSVQFSTGRHRSHQAFQELDGVVYVRCEFRWLSMDAQIHFDADGDISGFRFDPVGEGRAAIEMELIAEAPERCCTNGDPYGVDDRRISFLLEGARAEALDVLGPPDLRAVRVRS